MLIFAHSQMKGGYYCNTLQAASYNGRKAIVDIPLNRGGEDNPAEWHYKRYYQMAVRRFSKYCLIRGPRTMYRAGSTAMHNTQLHAICTRHLFKYCMNGEPRTIYREGSSVMHDMRLQVALPNRNLLIYQQDDMEDSRCYTLQIVFERQKDLDDWEGTKVLFPT